MKDETVPKGPWEFNKDVADVFPDMLERSIPGYYDMRECVLRMGFPFVYGGNLLDLGCSDGQMTEMFMKRSPAKKTVMIDNSEPMLEKCREKFKSLEGAVEIRNQDISKPLRLEKETYSCALSILVLQFIPVNERKKVIKQIYNALRPGGALIMVEKTMFLDGESQDYFTTVYHYLKFDHGYTWEQIKSKAESLNGVLIPNTSECNKSMLKAGGFKHVETFWKSLQFEGYIAIK